MVIVHLLVLLCLKLVNKHHIIPIYGLYADYDNTIVLRSENKEKVINIKTDKLPDDFGEVLCDGNYSFYNGNYPYASDSNGNVRWYLNKKYYGDITVYKDNIIIGNDSYTEDNHSTGIYRMNFLGKVYGIYLVMIIMVIVFMLMVIFMLYLRILL